MRSAIAGSRMILATADCKRSTTLGDMPAGALQTQHVSDVKALDTGLVASRHVRQRRRALEHADAQSTQFADIDLRDHVGKTRPSGLNFVKLVHVPYRGGTALVRPPARRKFPS